MLGTCRALCHLERKPEKRGLEKRSRTFLVFYPGFVNKVYHDHHYFLKDIVSGWNPPHEDYSPPSSHGKAPHCMLTVLTSFILHRATTTFFDDKLAQTLQQTGCLGIRVISVSKNLQVSCSAVG